MYGLYLNEHDAGKLVLNFVKRKLEEVQSKISSLEGQAKTQNLTKMRLFMPLN